jgi:hypothetical protein
MTPEPQGAHAVKGMLAALVAMRPLTAPVPRGERAVIGGRWNLPPRTPAGRPVVAVEAADAQAGLDRAAGGARGAAAQLLSRFVAALEASHAQAGRDRRSTDRADIATP